MDHTALGTVAAGTAEVLYYLQDALNSTIGLADASGNLVERYVYEPYGATRIEWPAATSPPIGTGAGQFAATTSDSPGMVQGEFVQSDLLDSRTGWVSRFGNPYLWTGQRHDAGSGTYHFLYRTYDPSLGRWFQRDPAGYIDGPKLYQYVMSSPLNYIDPLGLALITDPLAPGFPAYPDPGFGDPSFPGFGAPLFGIPP